MRKILQDYNFLPISINITGKKILLIGGGKVGYHKASILHRFTDDVTVLSPEFHENFYSLPFQRIRKEYETGDLSGFFLIYICTGDKALNRRIKADAEALNILASVCDNPSLCDFVSPAIHKEGEMTIAVGSNAQDVRRSIAVRNRISELIKEGVLELFTTLQIK
ncbi:MAG: bifunctional precorrin-2 dehydrogenase/sirohydrochlorin ferrochelatase [Candidatus Symbiothrix sp.]|jgi:siroheme synthase-like protein|nr:bifunctional precorrin-2 dehydrogenase/sirohydrochlorin ferrochelatase [Candidatus Symbiothrix sp.]